LMPRALSRRRWLRSALSRGVLMLLAYFRKYYRKYITIVACSKAD
jgi:hypothetical protein